MQFEFQGVPYRIGFRHDPDRSLAAHVEHAVAINRFLNARAELWCVPCNVKLLPLSKGELLRNTVCMIQRREPGDDGQMVWRTVFHGDGKLNRKAGDAFSREGGRCASLAAALKDADAVWGKNRGFHAKAWNALMERRSRKAGAQ